jgi:hypothetical protein
MTKLHFDCIIILLLVYYNMIYFKNLEKFVFLQLNIK